MRKVLAYCSTSGNWQFCKLIQGWLLGQYCRNGRLEREAHPLKDRSQVGSWRTNLDYVPGKLPAPTQFNRDVIDGRGASRDAITLGGYYSEEDLVRWLSACHIPNGRVIV